MNSMLYKGALRLEVILEAFMMAFSVINKSLDLCQSQANY